MDFSLVGKELAKEIKKAVDYVLLLKISPDDKINELSMIFSAIGKEAFNKIFKDASLLFASEFFKSEVEDNFNAKTNGLAEIVVREHNLGRSERNSALLDEYFQSIIGDATNKAFSNAKSIERRPTLTRRVVGETCKWCINRAGTFVNPDSTYFARHENCDCEITVSGYNSRNGKLKNYVKV